MKEVLIITNYFKSHETGLLFRTATLEKGKKNFTVTIVFQKAHEKTNISDECLVFRLLCPYYGLQNENIPISSLYMIYFFIF